MEFETDLNKLEQNVEKLLSNLDHIQDDKSKLLADIARLEKDKKSLGEQVAALQEEKAAILKRVNLLIESIERWEKAAVSQEQTSSSPMRSETGATDETGQIEPVQGVLLGN
jgi:peptidoglycan hydrolase CwlO-like protein